MSLDQLYTKLRKLVKGNVIISFHDRQPYNLYCKVGLVFQKDSYCWTQFEGKDLVDAFERALDKLKHPEKDYLDITGCLWKANESSCFCQQHIELFLNKGEG